MNTHFGRVIVIVVGFSLFAFGSKKMFGGLTQSVKSLFKKEEDPKYVQQKLI